MTLTIYQKSTNKALFTSASFKEIKKFLYQLYAQYCKDNNVTVETNFRFNTFMNDFIIK